MGEPDDALGVSLALEGESSHEAVRLLGLFAFDAGLPNLRCETYESGEFDPFDAYSDEQLAGISFFGVGELEEEGNQRFDGITAGTRVIIVEAYDGDGARLFLGCTANVAVDSGQTTEVQITLKPDPRLSDS
ncbi:MAG: hypothetical protein HYY06_24125 [Deltaproteobacteria bacterium]|nr:hypothetical protein [Deltaproteobacteria bacterium]